MEAIYLQSILSFGYIGFGTAFSEDRVLLVFSYGFMVFFHALLLGIAVVKTSLGKNHNYPFSFFPFLFRMGSKLMLGYTYMNPTLLNPDSAIISNISGPTNTLKYRYRHSVKFDIENSWRKISLGTTVLYNSFMQNIDEVFENSKPEENPFGVIFELGTGLPTTIQEFRKKYNKGTLIWDIRLAYQFTKEVRSSFIIKNVLNTVYSERPAILGAPRNFTLQLSVDL